VAKLPTRSPTHEDVPLARLSSMGLEIEEIAQEGGDQVTLAQLVELAEDRGRPVSHYVAAVALATELTIAPRGDAPVTIKVCVGTCQRYGALDVIDHLVTGGRPLALAPVSCLDRCDQAPACEVHGAHGQLVLAPATPATLDEALAQLS